jgi:dipeptidyl aminopeptidase/acylaminoacyl peptidase
MVVAAARGQAGWSAVHGSREQAAVASRPVRRITGAMLARSKTVADPRWSPAGTHLAWVEQHDGRSDLVVAPASGAPAVVAGADHGVGGGFCWAGDEELVVAGGDGRLAVVHAEGGLVRYLTRDGRAFAPAVSVRGEVACAVERDDACDVVVVPVDGSQWPQRVSRADYAWDPAWSPDGRDLAWHEWTLPDMPWDASRIAVRDDDGKTRVVADAPACGQPRFAPDGSHLAYVREAQLWVDGAPLLAEAYEHAEPSWSAGQRSYAWSPDGAQLAWCRNEDGFGRLVIGAPGRKSARELSKGWHRGIDWGAPGIVCARSGAVTPTQITVLAPNGSARRTIARGPVGGFEHTGLVEPAHVSWRSGNATVHGLLWRPEALGAPPPLVVSVHGGPTGQALADWNPRVQYLVQRGWAVLEPNYRGSTGYGEHYRRALAGRWGERDTADVAAAIRHAVKEGWGDGRTVVCMGGSAGALTVLNLAARHPDLVSAVVARYPVADILELHATTHRFESGYAEHLAGPLPEARDAFVRHSPLTHAGEIRAPVLLLHGGADEVVLPSQSAALEERLRRAGTPVERHVFEGEKHGWRRAATVARELECIESFLRRHLG